MLKLLLIQFPRIVYIVFQPEKWIFWKWICWSMKNWLISKCTYMYRCFCISHYHTVGKEDCGDFKWWNILWFENHFIIHALVSECVIIKSVMDNTYKIFPASHRSFPLMIMLLFTLDQYYVFALLWPCKCYSELSSMVNHD